MSRLGWLVLSVLSLAAGWCTGWALDPERAAGLSYRVPAATAPPTHSPPAQIVGVVTDTVTVTVTPPPPRTRPSEPRAPSTTALPTSAATSSPAPRPEPDPDACPEPGLDLGDLAELVAGGSTPDPSTSAPGAGTSTPQEEPCSPRSFG